MQKVEDLKEIFTATHDLGVAWQNELVKLRAENFRLVEENKTLEENYNKLSEENKNLNEELKDISEKIQTLRGDIFKELNARNSDEFQKFVKDYLKKIRECVDGAIATEKPEEIHNAEENIIAEESRIFDDDERPPKYD